jgi:hypothetical protein
MAFGGGGWAALAFGAGAGSVAYMRLAIVSGRNAIDAEFTASLQVLDATIADDALNPDNWTLTAADPTSHIPFIQVVEALDDGATIRIYFDADLTDGATYTIAIDSSVPDADGNPITAPYDADVVVPLLGFVPVVARLPGEQRVDVRSAASAYKKVGGTPRYDATGDLANETGADYLRKRIIRRVTHVRGSIFHLPNYGAGKRLKTLITPAKMAAYQAEVKAQVLREPDVRGAEVAVERIAANVLRISIKPTDVTGAVLPEIVFSVKTEG